jgi:hypothetical protein
MFPFSVLLISVLLKIWAVKINNTRLSKICQATHYTIITYILGGVILFPLYFAFKPIKIDGITYLVGYNLWIYWLLDLIIVTPAVTISIAYFQYFKKVPIQNYKIEALFLGLYQLILSLFFEIVIYVYWRKTLPSIHAYFFGKNFPWIDINWVIGFLCVFVAAYIAKKKNKV